eukprot:scaffold3808_cov112-Isochrysis_galbana.AAC.38
MQFAGARPSDHTSFGRRAAVGARRAGAHRMGGELAYETGKPPPRPSRHWTRPGDCDPPSPW